MPEGPEAYTMAKILNEKLINSKLEFIDCSMRIVITLHLVFTL